MVDGIKPDLFFDGRVEHGRVICGINRAEAWGQCAYALIAIDLDFQNLHRQGVSGFSAVDKKWPGKRIVSWSHAESVAGFLDGVAKTVHGVGLKNVAGLQMSDRTV